MPDVTEVPHLPGAAGRVGYGAPAPHPAGPGGDGGSGRVPRLVAPGFGHPMLAPLEWAELARPGTPVDWALLDLADGPGERPDRFATAAAARLRVRGKAVLGGLTLGGPGAGGCTPAVRPAGARLLREARRYVDWYRVDGFLVRGCPGGREHLAEVAGLVHALRALLPGARVVLDTGGHPCREYADLADQLVTFRGSWSAYRWSQVAQWTADYPPERFCHLVCEVPRRRLPEALRIARWQGVGAVYLTDRTSRHGLDPWSALPGYWDALVSGVKMTVSE